jgi:hypothetical protein
VHQLICHPTQRADPCEHLQPLPQLAPQHPGHAEPQVLVGVELLRQPALLAESRPEPVLRAELWDIEAIRSWASAAGAKIVSELAVATAMPEASIAEATRSSINAASKTCERSGTLDHSEGFDGALHAGSIVTGHVDELTRAAKKFDGGMEHVEWQKTGDVVVDMD